MIERESFLLYTNFQPMFERLNDAEAGHLIKAIFHLVKTGNDMPISNEATNMAYMFIKNQLFIDRKKWNEIIEKRREAGRKGGLAERKVKQMPANACFAKQEEAKDSFAKHNENVNENVNDNKTENELQLSNSQKAAGELAEQLFTSHRKEHPDFLSGKKEKEIQAKLVGWADDIEKLIRLDKKTPENIRLVISWIKSKGNFWFPNIISGKKLREKYETVWAQMQSKGQNQKHRIGMDNVPKEKASSYFKEAD